VTPNTTIGFMAEQINVQLRDAKAARMALSGEATKRSRHEATPRGVRGTVGDWFARLLPSPGLRPAQRPVEVRGSALDPVR
jgi:hypothetical protein